VAFNSSATNLVPGDTNGQSDIFVRDRQGGTTELVSIDSGGAQGNSGSVYPSISADGRCVAFQSWATNLVLGVSGLQVYVHDRQAGTTTIVSVDSVGVQGNGDSVVPSISADGRFVAFISPATNFVVGDTNAASDIFVHDRQGGATERVSVDSGGAQGNSLSEFNSISADGRYVAFRSLSSNLVPGDTNGVWDVFVHDRRSGATERVSLGSGGAQGNGDSVWSSISADGRYVAFDCAATNLVSEDTNGLWDIFVRDRLGGTTERVSVGSLGAQGDGSSQYSTAIFGISSDGRFVVFPSLASNLVAGDTNGSRDVFVRDRGPGFAITSFCFGDGTSIPCPCGNSGLSDHGCNNSASTGGALLYGNGEALLSADTLLLTSSGERPAAFSLFWQGGSEIAPRVFGDGVGCIGSPLKRMYGHNAIGGTATAPQGTDLSVSARSAALGDPISPGTTRGYYVFYRDPDPNFCPTPFGSTFNTTNGVRVLWGQ
jgi:Tol biopolymer transport system component